MVKSHNGRGMKSLNTLTNDEVQHWFKDHLQYPDRICQIFDGVDGNIIEYCYHGVSNIQTIWIGLHFSFFQRESLERDGIEASIFPLSKKNAKPCEWVNQIDLNTKMTNFFFIFE